jgi:hypothetical protein
MAVNMSDYDFGEFFDSLVKNTVCPFLLYTVYTIYLVFHYGNAKCSLSNVELDLNVRF